MLAVCTAIAGVVVVQHASTRDRRVVCARQRRACCMRVSKLVHLALLQQSVVLVSVATYRRTDTSTGAEVVFFLLEIMGRVRGKGGLCLRGKGGIGDGVGQGSGAAEMRDIAEGHEGSDAEEQAIILLADILGKPWVYSQDNNAQNHSSCADLAFTCASVGPVIASAFAAAAASISSARRTRAAAAGTGAGVGTRVRTSLTLTLRHIASHTNPGREPQNGVQAVDGCEGINVSEAACARPHGHGHEVDQAGDTKPTLE